MERSISKEERIRRAEEIYQRRRETNGVRVSTVPVNHTTGKDFKLFKKMLLQDVYKRQELFLVPMYFLRAIMMLIIKKHNK